MTKHKDNIIKLRDQGKSYTEIQKILGCSKGTIAYHIGDGQKEKARIRQRNLRKDISKYVQEYKQSRPCSDCKKSYPYWVMDFDHLGNKSFTISSYKGSTSSLEKVKLEIEKCDVVCSNCHRIRTWNRSVETIGL